MLEAVPIRLPICALGERCGAAFSHHDGGIEDRPDLLRNLAARADLVLFPVDCVSHDAAFRVKRLCRQAGKRYVPLRSAALGCFVAALGQIADAFKAGRDQVEP